MLLSNLANRIQPILRYDLGDSVTTRTDPCPCGDPTPAIHVQGRTAELLTFPGNARALRFNNTPHAECRLGQSSGPE
nr:hypothetical protein GCM10017547_35560 [Pseudarthrobacter oxydans]